MFRVENVDLLFEWYFHISFSYSVYKPYSPESIDLEMEDSKLSPRLKEDKPPFIDEIPVEQKMSHSQLSLSTNPHDSERYFCSHKI